MSAKISSSELREWLRDNMRAHPGTLLAQGYQASVRVYQSPLGKVIVKSPHQSLLAGWIGKAAIRHEAQVYARLGEVAGVPRCFGLVDGQHLVLEYIEGHSLRRHESDLQDAAGFYSRLLKTLNSMHEAGVAHGDLKRKDNVIVGTGEQPYVVDFGIASLRPTPERGWRALRFRLTEQLDNNAWIKLKYRRRTDAIAAADAPLYRPLWIERVARCLRICWQKATLRRPRQRWRKRRREKRSLEP